MTEDSILLTVYNRQPEILGRTLWQLCQNDLERAEIVIVDDASTVDYAEMRSRLQEALPSRAAKRINWHRIDTSADNPGTYSLDGYNNPAYSWLSAVRFSTGKRLWFVSSDCLVGSDGLDKARQFDLTKAAYHARTVNSTGQEFCGQQRPAPYGWFFGMTREVYEGMGGHDLGYLRGISFEDNDFCARVMLKAGRIGIDLDNTVVHQDHENFWASDGLKGWHQNEAYTREKWHGRIPFAADPAYEAVPHYLEWSDRILYVVPRDGTPEPLPIATTRPDGSPFKVDPA